MKKLRVLLAFLAVFLSSHTVYAQVILGEEQAEWNLALNKGEDLSRFYWEQPTLFLEHEIYQGKEDIQKQLEELIASEGKLNRHVNKGTVFQGKNNYFEIGYYVYEKARYGFVIGWKKVDETWLREIDILFKTEDAPEIEVSQINDARNLWMKLSNAHDPKALIQQVYTPDAVYVNQGKVYTGTEEITQRYSYMSNPNWKIQLNAKKTQEIQGNLFFEIGQYISNGTGHYVIIWERQENGEWQACLDFNF